VQKVGGEERREKRGVSKGKILREEKRKREEKSNLYSAAIWRERHVGLGGGQ